MYGKICTTKANASSHTGRRYAEREQTMTYKDIQEDVVKKYRVKLDEHSCCWGRMHAHVRERRVCKWHPKNSVQATFDLLHEVGHIETTKSGMRRAEEEYYATKWALDRAKEYGLEIPDKVRADYQAYIDMEVARGKRRGGANYQKMIL